MDDIVRQALLKWPNVPDCHGWLGLDARGDWYMRDAAAQAAGRFAEAALQGLRAAKGSRLEHRRLIEFIGRNYAADGAGCWYFQNGPQRVYVELQCAPWVWRLGPEGQVHSHTGQRAHPERALVDEAGLLYLSSDLGLGVVHTQDMAVAADVLEQGQWPLETVRAADLPGRFGHVLSPAADFALQSRA